MGDTHTIVEANAESAVITNQLLKNVITQITDRPKGNVHVKYFTVQDGSQRGDSYASVTLSVKATVQIGDVETIYHLFFKIPHSEGMMKDWLINRANIFTKESLAYLEVIPAMVGLQRDNGLKHMGPSVPMHIYSIIEKAGGLVVLEDLGPKDYSLIDKGRVLDEAHCRLVMKELAIFHALSFTLKKEKPLHLREWGAVLQEATYISPFPDIFYYGFKSNLALVKDLTKDQKIIEAAEKLQGMDLNILMSSQLKPNEPFTLICHGDVWCNNLLFRYEVQDDTKIPVDVKIVDLQCLRYALPTTDITHFFFTSTTRTTRKKHLKNLLALYHSHFTDCLKSVNADFPEFTFDVLEQLFKQSALFGIAIACIFTPATMSKHTPDVSRVQEGTMDEHFLDATNKMLSIEENRSILKDRLIGVIEDAVEMGLL